MWQNRHRLLIFTPLLTIFFFCVIYIPGNLFVDLTLKEIGLLTVAGLSLWLTRKWLSVFVLLVCFWVYMLYAYPLLFMVPTLKLFPWLMFARVAGRCTILYPVILSILALHIDLNGLSLRRKRIVAGCLVTLACVELGTAYSLRLHYQQPEKLSQDFFAYMDYVRRQPGEAVLDWPFCIASGGEPAIFVRIIFTTAASLHYEGFTKKR